MKRVKIVEGKKNWRGVSLNVEVTVGHERGVFFFVFFFFLFSVGNWRGFCEFLNVGVFCFCLFFFHLAFRWDRCNLVVFFTVLKT